MKPRITQMTRLGADLYAEDIVLPAQYSYTP